jgi:hypothetical protein
MPRATKSLKDDPRYFSERTHKPESDLTDEMLFGAGVLSVMVAITGFLVVVIRLFK